MRWPCSVLLVLVLLTTRSTQTVRAEDPPGPPKRFDLAAIDAYVAGQVREKGYVGCSLAIVRNGKIVFAKGYGQRSLEPSRPVTEDTAFAIGSVTKQFICGCIFLLADEGKLSVRDSVAKYYPGLTRAQDITLLDLMNHVSGYPDYYPLDFVDRRMFKATTADQIIQEYAGGKLDFEPGTRWSYSNTGYTILGRVVEKVSSEPLGTFLQRRLFGPLQMKHTAFVPRAETPELARGYTAFALGPPEPAVQEAAGWLDAAGGIYASAADLARWDVALVSGPLLKPESYQLMTTPRLLSNGKSSQYGCGLAIAQRSGETLLEHGGAVSGFLASNVIVPRTKSAVVLLANSEDISPRPLRDTIVTLLLKDQPDQEGTRVPKIQGPSAKETALAFFHEMQAGAVDRTKLGEEFSYFLTEARLRDAAARLKPLGEPENVEVRNTSERGGMEVADVHLTFKTLKLAGLLYRTPDGKIQQLLFHKE